ncbi:MAG TPA: TIGR02466 family protein [Ferrovibrio sp.]|uniref:TIGR02466 family protein n=1 Tax=Ferrovibrio sp. TaxID=1917215 RepID=UPI002B4B8BBF|nr:TIGR02466 family protein [Ferrovibrio sp.]HLT78418.1 TIGR02466 family protein [Ferrovibrio sp.]
MTKLTDMALLSLFPTRIYVAGLKKTGLERFNRDLIGECEALRLADEAGRRWSERNYPGGYTSYGSHDRLHAFSGIFQALEKALYPHVKTYAAELGYDLRGRRLVMTDCWVNMMAGPVTHGLHLHPLSFISGTYYVQVPRGSAPIKFEDPRLDRLMAAPPKRADLPAREQTHFSVPPKAGRVVLFESWLRHEVPPSFTSRERISVSFNYAWSDKA